MRLTKNEKSVLKFLLDNARMSDLAMASKLNISSQAVGKIRKKLEKEVIKSYVTNLDYKNLGIRVFIPFTVSSIKDRNKVFKKEIEDNLITNPHIVYLSKVPGKSFFIAIGAFETLESSEDFFNELKKQKEFTDIDFREMGSYSSQCLLKNSEIPLFHKIVDGNFGT